MPTQFWLMKTEPDECSIDDFAKDPNKPIRWDGVRNYQARNFIRDMGLGDQVLIYHSSCKNIGIAGIVTVAKSAYPDPSQFDAHSPYFDAKSTLDNPRWSAVDLVFHCKFSSVLSLQTIKHIDAMQNSPLIKKGNRLSVLPLSQSEWGCVIARVQKR